MLQGVLPLQKLQVAGENTIHCRGVSVLDRCGIVGNDHTSSNSKNSDGIGAGCYSRDNRISHNVSDGAVKYQSPGNSKDYPIVLDIDDYTPDSPIEAGSLTDVCLEPDSRDKSNAVQANIQLERRLSQQHTHSSKESQAPSPEDRTPTASPTKDTRPLALSRKRSPSSDNNTGPLRNSSFSKRPRRNIARTCRAGETDRMVEKDSENAPGYICSRQRLNWRVKDLDSVHLEKDGSIQCTVIWELTVVAKTDLVGAALHNRCEELFKKTYGQGEWKKWLVTHYASKRRGRKIGAEPA